MKKLFLAFSLLALGLLTNAQPPEGDAKPGEWYGEKVNPEGAMPVSDAVAKLNNGKEEVDGKIKAKIVEVCEKKGCWIKLDLGNGETATVKMKDYGFFLPLTAKGKTVVIDGEIKIKTTSVAELKHYAEDAGKSKEEIAAIKEPKKEVRVMAKGIVVVE
ncbi:MAG: DUF4920 domain-containing protein [Bacteroidota bacterium]